jgi:uncharacterized membrane protein
MPFLALSLILLSALIHAAWNVLLKRARHLEAFTLALFAGSALLSAGLSLVWPGSCFPKGSSLGWALASGAFEGLYIVGLVRAMSLAPAGWAYGWSRGSAVLAVWPLSIVLFHEPLTPLTIAFAALVALGLLVMGASRVGHRGRGALPWAVLSGCSIAAFNLCYKGALKSGAQPAALFSVSIAMGSALQALEQRRRGLSSTFKSYLQQPALLAFCTVACTGGFLLYLFAMQTAGAARVTTLRNTSVVFAQGIALALGERPGWRGWSGAVLITLGALGLGWAH